jgi:hypothetical protein
VFWILFENEKKHSMESIALVEGLEVRIPEAHYPTSQLSFISYDLYLSKFKMNKPIYARFKIRNINLPDRECTCITR